MPLFFKKKKKITNNKQKKVNKYPYQKEEHNYDKDLTDEQFFDLTDE